jgi:hypothetical protein
MIVYALLSIEKSIQEKEIKRIDMVAKVQDIAEE